MANTYTQMYMQIVSTVKGRNSLIAAQNRDELKTIEITGKSISHVVNYAFMEKRIQNSTL